MSNYTERIRRIDHHTPVSDEFRARTVQGAVFSVIAILSAGYFMSTELSYNMSTQIVDRVYVNSTPSATAVQMEFDVTFQEIACSLLGIDANDAVGNSQSLHTDRTHHVYKHRLNKDGRNVHRSRPEKTELGGTVTDEKTITDAAKKRGLTEESAGDDYYIDDYFQKDFCGDCYGAAADGECCNTCDDVKRMYRAAGWKLPNIADIAQCKNEVRAKDEVGEGCRIEGTVQLASTGGNLHIAPGRETEDIGGGNGKFSISDLLGLAFEQYNVTHTINKLHFGPEFPGGVRQLDGQIRNVGDSHGMYQYYIQIIPTEYVGLDGTRILTNQMSVTEHMRIVKPGSGRGLPGVFFFYEVSPFHVVFEETRRGWTRFFTSVCAVVGGVYTVLQMIDKAWYLWSKGGSAANLCF
eukprot:CAMPEP_0194279710 /NCGR_PEP_ID=MMETSP0169-20130528/14077_1 /TAXON_ID=218684 /ORGANISM="Corethron pennatum, Strain L29A3" /LENGTH=407 /DNA_ID=CAMNT_0039024165 /DNA_START=118 /DNA_END=1341 /DNA_ORIENTATION=-